MGVYTTVADLRAQPEIPDVAPPDDATLEQTISLAEDRIDDWLGGWPVRLDGPSIGRKIVEDEVEPVAWEKLGTATVRLAARLYANPRLLDGPEWTEISGPDFSTKGRAPTLRKLQDVVAPLNASGLRQLGARATA